MPLARFVLLLLIAPLAAAGESAEEWLRRMDEAVRNTDYEGTLIYLDGERLEMLRIYHSAAADKERLVTLSGPHREVIREGRSVTCIGLGRPATVYDGAGLAALSPVARAIRNGRLPHYEVEVAGSDRAAGRLARQIEIRAGDAYRYGYRLWLDEATAFPLRVSLLDAAGETVEDLAFTDIRLDTAPDPAKLEPQSQQALRRVRLPPSREADPPAAPTDALPGLPSGFTLRDRRESPEGEEHWVFSDGLASVSVYVKPAPTAASSESASRWGSVHARLIQHDGRRVYAIGKVPAETVDHLARSLARQALADAGD